MVTTVADVKMGHMERPLKIKFKEAKEAKGKEANSAPARTQQKDKDRPAEMYISTQQNRAE